MLKNDISFRPSQNLFDVLESHDDKIAVVSYPLLKPCMCWEGKP